VDDESSAAQPHLIDLANDWRYQGDLSVIYGLCARSSGFDCIHLRCSWPVSHPPFQNTSAWKLTHFNHQIAIASARFGLLLTNSRILGSSQWPILLQARCLPIHVNVGARVQLFTQGPGCSCVQSARRAVEKLGSRCQTARYYQVIPPPIAR
jgi:hypothetical protein